jgi:hypothetical protein
MDGTFRSEWRGCRVCEAGEAPGEALALSTIHSPLSTITLANPATLGRRALSLLSPSLCELALVRLALTA